MSWEWRFTIRPIVPSFRMIAPHRYKWTLPAKPRSSMSGIANQQLACQRLSFTIPHDARHRAPCASGSTQVCNRPFVELSHVKGFLPQEGRHWTYIHALFAAALLGTRHSPCPRRRVGRGSARLGNRARHPYGRPCAWTLAHPGGKPMAPRPRDAGHPPADHYHGRQTCKASLFFHWPHARGVRSERHAPSHRLSRQPDVWPHRSDRKAAICRLNRHAGYRGLP